LTWTNERIWIEQSTILTLGVLTFIRGTTATMVTHHSKYQDFVVYEKKVYNKWLCFHASFLMLVDCNHSYLLFSSSECFARLHLFGPKII
jgi:hypothetical protein